MNHTSEPWYAEGGCNDPHFFAITAGEPDGDNDRPDMVAEVTTEANRLRIVACVNKLAEHSNLDAVEVIPAATMAEVREALKHAAAALEREGLIIRAQSCARVLAKLKET